MNDEKIVRPPERREARRYGVTIDIKWQGKGGRSDGTLSDLSSAGCFVLSGAEVSDGETVHIFIPIGDGMNAQFSGVVVNHEDEIGFAVRFHALIDAQKGVLKNLIADEKSA